MGVVYLALVKYLQQNVHNVRVRLFYLIEQNYGIRLAAYSFSQLPCLVVPHISWRRTDDLGNAVLLHVLRHVEPDERLHGVEHFLSQHLDKFRLAHAGGTHKDERSGSAPVGELHPGALDCLCDQLARLVLTYNMLLEVLLQAADALVFRFLDLVGRDTCPHLYHLGDIIDGDFNILCLVLDLFDAVVGLRYLHLDLCQLLIVDIRAFSGYLAFVGAQLCHPGFQLFIFGYIRASKACACAGFVKQVYCLIRQESVVDVSFRKHRAHACYLRRNPDLVVILVIFLDTLQQLYGVLDVGLVDCHRLEAALKRAVLFDILAVLVERCRADNLQFPAGKSGLEHVGSVHCSLGIAAGADQVVHLVYEQHYVSGSLYLVDKGLHAALKLTAELRACHKRSQVKQVQFLALQPERNVAACQPQRDPLGDSGLADAGFTDKAGVVLCAP